MSSTTARRLLATVLSLAIVLSTTSAAPALAMDEPDVAATRGTVADDQPLPGYTISNPPLAPAIVGGAETKVLQGVHSHAGYVIEVPPNWNGHLTMWAHGYRGGGTVLTVDPPGYGLRQQMLNEGYAWAASSYYANGYDVRAGVTTTRELADLVGKLVGKPKKVFIAGVSMGGHVIGRSLEQYPGFYAGALPMCGVLGDHQLFDFFLDHNLVAQDLADVRAYPPPPDYVTNAVPRIQQALGLGGLKPGGPDTVNERGAQLRSIVINRSGGPRPGDVPAFAYWKDFLFGLGAPSQGTSLAANPGQLAQNITTRYTPDTPVDVNRSVQRVFPQNWQARLTPALTEVPQIFGAPTTPVLTLHGLGDLFVPFSMEQTYRDDVARSGRTNLLAQRAIRTVNHCEFDNAEVGAAWRDLVEWTGTGKRPAADVVNDPATVAAPDYGCRFSNPEAYRTPSPGSTRALFSSCP
jgi:pimeloyl-ACP methyl ester carboxylesterase